MGSDRMRSPVALARQAERCALTVVELRRGRIAGDVARGSDERIGRSRSRARMTTPLRPGASRRAQRHQCGQSDREDTARDPHPVPPESAPASPSGCTGESGTRQAERQRRRPASAGRNADAASLTPGTTAGRPSISLGV